MNRYLLLSSPYSFVITLSLHRLTRATGAIKGGMPLHFPSVTLSIYLSIYSSAWLCLVDAVSALDSTSTEKEKKKNRKKSLLWSWVISPGGEAKVVVDSAF